MKETFTSLIDQSEKILIVGHLTPDFDAYACMLFTYNVIKENFPKKEVIMCLDTKEPHNKLKNLKGFDMIQYGDIYEKAKEIKPDFMIFVDGSRLSRFTNKPKDLKKLLINRKTALIDHHKIIDQDFNFFYNTGNSSGVEVLYNLLIVKEKLSNYKDWEETFLTGLVGDTYRFYHQGKGYRSTFSIVSDILDKGYTLRKTSDTLFSFTPTEMDIIKTLFQNTMYMKEYVFSIISTENYNSIKNNVTVHGYKTARRYFVDNILINVEGYNFCMTLVPDRDIDDGKTYSGSFRSKPNTVDCTVLAKYLNGGGHVTGAGFEVIANSIDEAKTIVEKVITEHLDEAKINNQ